MRTQFLSLALGGGPIVVPCEHDQRVRIIAVRAIIGTGSQGDQCFVNYSRSNEVFISHAMPVQQGTEAFLCAAIGATPTQPLPSIIDPATGVIGYTNVQTNSAGLVDAWFDFEVVVEFDTSSGTTIGLTTVTYQVESVSRPAKRSAVVSRQRK